MDRELKPARRLIGDAVLVEGRLLRNRSEKTNAVSSLTALLHEPSPGRARRTTRPSLVSCQISSADIPGSRAHKHIGGEVFLASYPSKGNKLLDSTTSRADDCDGGGVS